MHGVHNSRNAQGACGKTAENAPLGAVGMHYLGFKLAQYCLYGSVGLKVPPGVNFSTQRIYEGNLDGSRLRCFQQRPFGSNGRTRDEQNFIAIHFRQIDAVEERVFLRAAKDHARDDMGNLHGAIPSRGADRSEGKAG